MEIDLLYVPNCPNYETARDRLSRALARIGRDAVVRERPVHSSAEAARLGMHGSPTVLIDGHDPFEVGHDPAALSCRLYPGAVAARGAPSVDELVDVLGR